MTSHDADPKDPTVGGDEVDSFDEKLEKFIHTYIADATPTDGPAPGA